MKLQYRTRHIDVQQQYIYKLIIKKEWDVK